MQGELLLHAHLMCLNRFDADMQFTRQFGNAEASADKRKNLQLTPLFLLTRCGGAKLAIL
jgi:hypothetical protein